MACMARPVSCEVMSTSPTSARKSCTRRIAASAASVGKVEWVNTTRPIWVLSMRCCSTASRSGFSENMLTDISCMNAILGIVLESYDCRVTTPSNRCNVGLGKADDLGRKRWLDTEHSSGRNNSEQVFYAKLGVRESPNLRKR